MIKEGTDNGVESMRVLFSTSSHVWWRAARNKVLAAQKNKKSKLNSDNKEEEEYEVFHVE